MKESKNHTEQIIINILAVSTAIFITMSVILGVMIHNLRSENAELAASPEAVHETTNVNIEDVLRESDAASPDQSQTEEPAATSDPAITDETDNVEADEQDDAEAVETLARRFLEAYYTYDIQGMGARRASLLSMVSGDTMEALFGDGGEDETYTQEAMFSEQYTSELDSATIYTAKKNGAYQLLAEVSYTLKDEFGDLPLTALFCIQIEEAAGAFAVTSCGLYH